MAKVIVWVAADAFLYLPIYALRDLGVLERVSTALGSKIEIEIKRPETGSGDFKAISRMLAAAREDMAQSEIIHVAIGDPFAALKKPNEFKDLRLVGAFIKKPPFWILGRESKLKDEDIRVVCYGPDLVTGYHFGEQYHEQINSDHKLILSNLGKEIDYLFDPNLGETSTQNPGTHRVVTADIIGVCRATFKDPTVKVLSKLAETNKNFVTTGITTFNYKIASDKKKEPQNQYEILSVFLEALRTSCILIDTAVEPTAQLILKLAASPEFKEQLDLGLLSGEPLTRKEAIGIATKIIDERLYESTLSFGTVDWENTIAAHKISDKAKMKKARLFYASSYDIRPATKKIELWMKFALEPYYYYVKKKKSAELHLALSSAIAGIALVALLLFQSRILPSGISSSLTTIFRFVTVCLIAYNFYTFTSTLIANRVLKMAVFQKIKQYSHNLVGETFWNAIIGLLLGLLLMIVLNMFSDDGLKTYTILDKGGTFVIPLLLSLVRPFIKEKKD